MTTISLNARHGRISGWEARPPSQAHGGVVVIQEIFGVNSHIRSVADEFAKHGFHAVAPALFDPVRHGCELGYDADGVAQGRQLVEELGYERALDGVRAAYDYLDGLGRKVVVVGFCWGGTIAFLANTRFGCPCVSYYGGRTVPFLNERPKAPLLMHFGSSDPIIPPDDVLKHREALPDADIYIWPAGHGFNCDQRADYIPEVAQQAMERTVSFIRRLTR